MFLQNILNGKEFSAEMQESFMRFHNLVERRLPEEVEVLLEKLIMESFAKEQYQDVAASHWQARRKLDSGRGLLIGKGSGKLKRSIEVSRNGNEVSASTDVIYAPVHNEGLRAGRGAGFQMPQRQFMPIPGEKNEKLDKAVEKFLDSEMDKIFK
jgi:phage gpG-like protein